MITLTKGNILEAKAQALVNTVNCVGVMGRGIALQFKKAYPENFKAYELACKHKELLPGRLFVFHTLSITHPRYIINFATKDHWKGKSRLEFVESGLRELVATIKKLGITSIAIPPIGCGLGGLKWSAVLPKIREALSAVPEVEVLVYEPSEVPVETPQEVTDKRPAMTQGRAALLGLMTRYLSALMDPFVSLLEIHKLMYFMQEDGERLRLNYAKALYGPYAENLRHVLNKIEGHFISGYENTEDKPEKQIQLIPPAGSEALSFLEGKPETRRRFDRVADLVQGFETSFGMELLATVHWVVKYEGAATPETAVERTYEWNNRKRMFDPEQIALAWNVLREKGWISSAYTKG